MKSTGSSVDRTPAALFVYAKEGDCRVMELVKGLAVSGVETFGMA